MSPLQLVDHSPTTRIRRSTSCGQCRCFSVDSVCVRNQQPDRLKIIQQTTTKHHLRHCYGAFSAYASRPAATRLSFVSSFFLFLEKILQGLFLSRPQMFHLVCKVTRWPPLLVGTHQQIAVLLLEEIGNKPWCRHCPSSHWVLQVERMMEEHAHARVWQSSDNDGNERRIAGILCERHHDAL